MYKLYNMDFNNYKEEVKANLILTDIPYNIGRDAYASNPRWWNDGKVENGRSEKADSMFFETDQDFNIDNFLQFCKDHLLEDSSVVVFCSHLQQFEIISKMKKYGFKKYIPLVFTKNNSAEVLKSNMRIVGACEYGLQLCNGRLPRFYNNGKMIKNYFNMRVLNNKRHPNEKDSQVLKQFIELFTLEGDLVIDPCMGCGSTGVVCYNNNRDFIGIEIDSKYYDVAVEYLKEAEYVNNI